MENSERWEKVLILRWDWILACVGNQNRESGPEVIGNCIFVSKALKRYEKSNFFLENSSECFMKDLFTRRIVYSSIVIH